MSIPKLLRPKAAAQLLGVSPVTLKRWRNISRKSDEPVGPAWLEHTTPGGLVEVRYQEPDVQAFIESQFVRVGGGA